jgi:multimeric flavodoxin WrbA
MRQVNARASRHLLIVYHSQTGHTRTMAKAVLRGARRVAEIDARLRMALRAGLDDLLWAHGLLLGTPENFGYMSGALKNFLDRTYYPAQGKVDGLPYAVFISAGNDGRGALSSIERVARGYPLKPVCEPIIARGELSAEVVRRCEELGETMASGVAWGIF